VALGLGLALGVLPGIWQTLFVCAPYGTLSWDALRYNWRASPSHAMVYGFLLVAAAAGLGVLALGRRLGAWLTGDTGRGWKAALVLAALVVPTVVAARFGANSGAVAAGLAELFNGGQWTLFVLWAGAVLVLLGRGDERRVPWFLALLGLVLPALLYLKGAEPFGMWSYRRLFPFYALFSLLTGYGVAAWCGRLSAAGAWRRGLMAVVVVGLGGANACRWPAAYTVAVERGAAAWVREWTPRFAGKTVLFDAHTYAAPFGVHKERVFGLGPVSFSKNGEIAAWLRNEAISRPVWLISTAPLPAFEEGLLLRPVTNVTFCLPRLRTRQALPAERVMIPETWYIAEVSPAPTPADRPALERPLDDGRWCLRGRWGRAATFRLPDGSRVAGRWTRRGSAVLGPLPPPGGAVTLELVADACRGDGRSQQTLALAPPWGGNPVEVAISNGYNHALLTLNRPAGAVTPEGWQGVYELSPLDPYDPATHGLAGYDADLGVLLQRIRIAVAPTAVAAEPVPEP